MGSQVRLQIYLFMLLVTCCFLVPVAPYEPRIPKDMSEWPYRPESGRLWDKADIEKALTYSNTASLHGLLRKLSAGQPIKVVAFGSSITSDHGGCWGDHDKVARYVRKPSLVYTCIYSKCHPTGWLTLFMAMINTYWPHPDHVLINNGMPGATGYAFALGTCTEQHLPKDADLIIFEELVMRVNSKANEGADHLIWRLRHHFSDALPPLVMFQTRTMTEDMDVDLCIRNSSLCEELPSCSIPSTWMEPHFEGEEIELQEDLLNNLAEYYGLSASFSVRDWYHAALKDALPKRQGLSNCEYLSKMFVDTTHPSETGRLLFSDCLTNMLMSAEQNLTSNPDTGYTDVNGVYDVYMRHLPNSSYIEGADSTRSIRCYSLDTAGSTAFVQQATGWQFVEYTVHGEVKKYKPGWVALEPASILQLKIDTVHEGQHPIAYAKLFISYLRSYEHMGVALVMCVSGCYCEGGTLDGNWNLTRTSQIHLHEMYTTQHKECVIQVQVMPFTYAPDKGHKFKINQIMTQGDTQTRADYLNFKNLADKESKTRRL